MVVNFKPDDNYKVDGVTTIPRTHDGESLAYISDKEALRLRERGGGVPPNDPSGQITKFGIPSFIGGGGGGGGAPNWLTSQTAPPPAAPAPSPAAPAPSPAPQVIYPSGVEDPYAPSSPPPPPYLSQPMPPGQEGQEQDLFWYKQNQDWVEENWVKNPAYEEWAQQPPSAKPADQPPQETPEQRQARGLSIEERNQRVLDIMSAQATSPVHPPDTKVELSPIELQQEELLAEQQIEQVAPITSDVAGAVPEIGVQGEFEAAQTEAARTEEIDRARAARLTRENISAEVFVQEADVIGTVSQQSLAQAQADNLDPKATVQGQLESLYVSIKDGQPLPPWASGPVRVASQIMQQRGLGASSIAGAALVQAVQEGAIPIAAADAQAYATIQLQNLSNKQATALQNALTYAQMDKLNQDARVKAAITNAQSFLQIDLANLTSEQSTEQINFQADAEEMFTDQAAENATRQFNATGKIQVDEFFADLGVRVDTRSTELAVANAQFNTDQTNAINQFNQQIINDRDKFEANLSTQIQQSNSVWRRSINTANNATQNEANRLNAQAILGLNEVGQANLWQAYRDDATFLIQTTEAALQRAHQVGILAQQQNFQADQYKEAANDAMFGQIGQLAGILIDNIFKRSS